ncbi:MAG TPA: acylneuraminate cytidylyltransferase family protein [Terriglobales bacterium]|nr:acylneuraminate cytidylyltransferase family protein [Terriglobales bacterium]
MKVVAVIPARGGSKGLPRKNVLPLGGKPLLAHTIADARAAKRVDRTLVSTDDAEIAEVARAWGAEVPFMRPAELATDAATTEVVLQHALAWLEGEERTAVDVIVLLEATSPFRAPGLVDEVVGALEDPAIDTAFTVVRDHGYFWRREADRIVRLDPAGYQPRQVRQPRWRETGSVYATRAAVVRGGERIGPRVALVEQDDVDALVDVHSAFDLWLAERMLADGKRG